MSKKNISFRLNSHVTAFAIIIISAIVYINYHFSKKILVRKIEEGAVTQSNLVVSKISKITVWTEEVARNVSVRFPYYYKHNDGDLFLNQVITTNPVIESLHVELYGGEDEKFSVCHSPGHCLHRCNQDDSIFPNDTLSLNRGLWSSPFYCSNDTSHLLVTYRYPIYHSDSHAVIGSVFCEISLRKLKQMLSEIQINHQGYTFLIDKEGNYLTFPNEKWIMTKNIFSDSTFSVNSNFHKIKHLISEGQTSAQHGISNHELAWFYFTPLPNTNWMAVIVMPEKELFKETDLILWKILWVCGVGIFLLFVLNMLIFRRILGPLEKIAESFERFSSLPRSEKNTGRDEIKILKDSFEIWQAKYGSLIKEKTQTESEKLKYEKELKSAREIQQNIIPAGKASFIEHPEIDLFATLIPANRVGGDLYDYFFIDQDHLLIAIGDVSGKGIPASLFMAVASTLLKTNARIISSKEIVEVINRELSIRNTDQYFLTLFVGVIDITTGIMDYCNAAHNYPYIIRSDGVLQTLSESHGLPLGIYKDKNYRNSSVELKCNDVLILFTDGIINATDNKNQFYGTDRLERNLQNLKDLTSEELVGKLVSSVTIFKGDSPQSDDISLLAMRCVKKTESLV